MGCKVGLLMVGEGLEGRLGEGVVPPRQETTAMASNKVANTNIGSRLCFLKMYTFDLILYIDELRSDEVPQPFPRFFLR